MCEVAEKIYTEGQTVGELNARKKTACTLKNMGMAEEDIAKAVHTDLAQVKAWLAEAAGLVE